MATFQWVRLATQASLKLEQSADAPERTIPLLVLIDPELLHPELLHPELGKFTLGKPYFPDMSSLPTCSSQQPIRPFGNHPARNWILQHQIWSLEGTPVAHNSFSKRFR